MTSTMPVRPGTVLSVAAALLGVAAGCYLLGAVWGGAQPQLYTTVATHTTLQTHPLATGELAHARHPGQAGRPLLPTPLAAGDLRTPEATAHSDTKVQSWLLPIVGLGSAVVGALLFAWNKPAGGRQLAEEWRAAAVELEEGFPGPGNPNDEFEVTVVWGGEERKLKVKG
eukprot:EG_transcript_36037